MSKHVRSRSLWEVLLQDEESPEPVGRVVGQLPSDEQPPQVEPPTQSQEMTPGQDNEDEGAPEFQDPDPEADLQELALAKTGREGKVKGESLPNLQPFQMPAAGPDPETDLQDLAQLTTGDEGSDGPVALEDILPKLESIYLPEAGTDLEIDVPDLAQLNSGDEGSEGPDVVEDILPKLESIYMPEEGPDPEDDLQELAQPNVDQEGRDGPDDTQELVSKLETIRMPEAGNAGFQHFSKLL
ncbi:regulator of G-protein signaling 3 isoform X1 [Rhinolophus ferrumequinum]|uniref:regulator of G-protein signaling 3 isoform X1 n=1 Tax=Rhinolophus ferrumequinum TaxID=59479 RepID=UPI00140F7612|nr:regulator of G-protein signaling 3 isoform X1 [Rhinolophus ferrumequinum]XP_032970907.1 regulator of G-protein signaling 3 isoform X1 [Rhinolophus ferrumequinum]XP_032970911.1 regulator of G-protein signaling 3 isoform X1 [Rhinolophus ferrumequinum]XP_032970923.1 regulator of G-protein signaling 3 isoform X1 [Rhinolophus ferrumequinum]